MNSSTLMGLTLSRSQPNVSRANDQKRGDRGKETSGEFGRQEGGNYADVFSRLPAFQIIRWNT
jgi:hypothetical protein